MTDQDKLTARGTTATVVATAAVTLAIGVTAAALGGYLAPNRGVVTSATEQAVTAVLEPSGPAAVSPPPAPSIVLVPVAPDSPAAQPTVIPDRAEPELLFAAYERDGDGEHQERFGGEDREHEDDDDDDD